MLSTNSDLDKRIAHMQSQEPTPLLLSLSAKRATNPEPRNQGIKEGGERALADEAAALAPRAPPMSLWAPHFFATPEVSRCLLLRKLSDWGGAVGEKCLLLSCVTTCDQKKSKSRLSFTSAVVKFSCVCVGLGPTCFQHVSQFWL